jgi:hypothetical protein
MILLDKRKVVFGNGHKKARSFLNLFREQRGYQTWMDFSPLPFMSLKKERRFVTGSS